MSANAPRAAHERTFRELAFGPCVDDSDLARAFFTSAVLVGVPRSAAAEFDSQHSDVPSFGKAEKSMTAPKMYC
jgi:hypothetical protein